MRDGNVHDVIVVTGTCVLGRWLAELVYEICAWGKVELAAEAEGVFPDFGRIDGVSRVLMTMALTPRHMDLVESGKVAVLAVLDDPVDSVRYTKAEKGFDTHQAVREQTRIACTNHLYLENSLATLVFRSFQGTTHDVVVSVLDRVRATLDPAVLQNVLERYGGPLDHPWGFERALEERVPNYCRLDRLGDAMTADEATTVRQALSPLVLAAVSHDIGPVIWSAKVLFYGDRPNEAAPPVADVTGAARILFYGPYYYLLPGTWKCRIVVAFSREAIGTPFRLVVRCLQDAIAKVILRPTEGGAYEGYFSMRHVHPDRSIEIQFASDEGTIEGHVALGQVSFTRLAG